MSDGEVIFKIRNPSKSERPLQKPHLSGIRTLCSPSPLPSPSGRGSIVGSAFDNPSRLELLQRGPWFSLSLRERAGVRGNGPWKVKTAGVLQLAPENHFSGSLFLRAGC